MLFRSAKMYHELGLQPSALNVAKHYGAQANVGLLTGFVFDEQDADQDSEITELGIRTLVTDTLMRSRTDRIRLAGEMVAFARSLSGG